MHRRTFLAGAGTAAWLACGSTLRNTPRRAEGVSAKIARIPHRGRLGVAILNTANGAVIGQRLDERFAMCSTFKLPLVAMTLRAVDQGEITLDKMIRYSAADLQPHAPVAAAHVSQGALPIKDLVRAAQTVSDNTAANLLLRELGGPAAFTRFCREMGDAVTRLDHAEPELNRVPQGSPEDTTSPRAIAHLVAEILVPGTLSEHSRSLLIRWMRDTKTGEKRLRAGFPRNLVAGDKTGTSLEDNVAGYCNDVACVWPARRPPLIVAAYYHAERGVSLDAAEAVLARVGGLTAEHIG